MAINEAALDEAVRLYRRMWTRDLVRASQPLVATQLRPTTVTLIILAYRRILAREASDSRPA